MIGAVKSKPSGLRLFSRLVNAATLILWSGCSLLQPLQEFSAIKSAASLRPNKNTADLPPVTLAAASGLGASLDGLATQRRSAKGSADFYVGFRVTEENATRFEATAVGFTFEQLRSIKASYALVRDDALKTAASMVRIELVVHPLEPVSWNTRNDRASLLMSVDRGVIVQLPKKLPANEEVYRRILLDWTQTVLAVAKNRKRLWPAFQVERVRCGRIDSVAARKPVSGVALAVPQGGAEMDAAALVEELSFVTGLPAVIGHGFTPAECGGATLPVSRPTEHRDGTDPGERQTARSEDVYRRYLKTVTRLAGGALEHYLELQQSADVNHFDVATVGVTTMQARAMKQAYYEMRERALKNLPSIRKIDFLIEPSDRIQVAAEAAKEKGVLRRASKGFHFTLPEAALFADERTRHAYAGVLSELIDWLVAKRG